MLERIHWLGHDAFRIDGPPIIYFDPYELDLDKPQPPADLILITHDHGDHCSPEDVAKLQAENTTIVTVYAAAGKLQGDIRVIKPGDLISAKGVDIEAIPAYNINKFRSPGVPFHPKESGYVGFVITVDGVRIYHAGDTDHIPEMAGLSSIDIALLPVSGHYVMTATEAAEAASSIQPGLVIPMHVGRGIGSMTNLRTFEKQATVDVKVLDIE
jgi:L-ascorbate metabolism protein UlaG (beta-lactamase superfamily)